ncbi:hypothetical protein FHX37_3894 [Haloactinospora alba]|uniref:Uncharacterized protein n=1 Tax=Haloactinospora alba TaxID=405555 RepID=A0A543N9T3_9ACTN|nr:hypothetical protein FHX37_3894 [Haloactinospora alba]
MAKYLLLKHYRGAPVPVNDVPMDQWTPEEVSAHMRFMRDFAARVGFGIRVREGADVSPDRPQDSSPRALRSSRTRRSTGGVLFRSAWVSHTTSAISLLGVRVPR